MAVETIDWFAVENILVIKAAWFVVIVVKEHCDGKSDYNCTEKYISYFQMSQETSRSPLRKDCSILKLNITQLCPKILQLY